MCKGCCWESLYEMVVSGKPYHYAGDIPCFRCTRYSEKQDLFVQRGEDNVKTSG